MTGNQPCPRCGTTVKPALTRKRRRRLDSNGRDETQYLQPIQEIVSSGMTAAEQLLEKFEGPWGGSVAPVFEEFAY